MQYVFSDNDVLRIFNAVQTKSNPLTPSHLRAINCDDALYGCSDVRGRVGGWLEMEWKPGELMRKLLKQNGPNLSPGHSTRNRS